jgi:hypothetical protein
VLTFDATFDSDVASFDAAGYAATLAALLNVSTSAVVLSVQAASVVVSATLEVPSEAAALTTALSIESAFSNTTTASATFGIPLEAFTKPQVGMIVTPAPRAPPPVAPPAVPPLMPPSNATANATESGIAAASAFDLALGLNFILGATALAGWLGCLVVLWRLRTSRRRSKIAPEAAPGASRYLRSPAAVATPQSTAARMGAVLNWHRASVERNLESRMREAAKGDSSSRVASWQAPASAPGGTQGHLVRSSSPPTPQRERRERRERRRDTAIEQAKGRMEEVADLQRGWAQWRLVVEQGQWQLAHTRRTVDALGQRRLARALRQWRRTAMFVDPDDGTGALSRAPPHHLWRAHNLFRTQYFLGASWRAWRLRYESHRRVLRIEWRLQSRAHRHHLGIAFRTWSQRYRAANRVVALPPPSMAPAASASAWAQPAYRVAPPLPPRASPLHYMQVGAPNASVGSPSHRRMHARFQLHEESGPSKLTTLLSVPEDAPQPTAGSQPIDSQGASEPKGDPTCSKVRLTRPVSAPMLHRPAPVVAARRMPRIGAPAYAPAPAWT